MPKTERSVDSVLRTLGPVLRREGKNTKREDTSDIRGLVSIAFAKGPPVARLPERALLLGRTVRVACKYPESDPPCLWGGTPTWHALCFKSTSTSHLGGGGRKRREGA